MFALFHNSRQISKAHSTREAVLIEAFERGLVYSSRGRCWLACDYAVRAA